MRTTNPAQCAGLIADNIYLDRANQDVNLFRSAANVLALGAGDSMLLTSPTIQGTVLAGTGLTMPAFTLGGAITGGSQAWTGVGNLTFAAGMALQTGVAATNTLLLQAYNVNGAAYTTFITLTAHATAPTCTLNNITMSGTWLASGTITLPAVSVNGNITMANATYLKPAAGVVVAGMMTADVFSGVLVYNHVYTGGYAGMVRIVTSNAAGSALVDRLKISGAVGNAIITIAAVGISHTFIDTTTAANDNINPAPTATILTMANTKSFTGIAYNIVLPAIVPVANGAGITLTGLNMAQGAITNAADTEAITVKQIILTGAAGVALATGVYNWVGMDITTPAQAANGAINTGFGIKITCGAAAGHANAYQRGIDITMAAATDAALRVNVGQIFMSASDIATDTTTGMKIGTGTTQKIGFFGFTPVVQQVHVADPTDLTTSIAAITAINAMCAAYGLTAAS